MAPLTLEQLNEIQPSADFSYVCWTGERYTVIGTQSNEPRHQHADIAMVELGVATPEAELKKLIKIQLLGALAIMDQHKAFPADINYAFDRLSRAAEHMLTLDALVHNTHAAPRGWDAV